MENSKSINVRYSNRPLKVAFIVPCTEENISHWVLDGIFYEAYTRWGGTKSLIIPFDEENFISESYLDWLAYYDPDFVYSYVDLTEEQVNTINRKALPIEMIRHRVHGELDRWRKLTPDWSYGFTPIRAISTINSPYAKYQGWQETAHSNLYITQHFENDVSRFLPDNFGISHDVIAYTYGHQNSYGTVCYCSEEIPENNNVGNERSHSITELVNKLSQKQANTFLKLSSIHASSINHPNEHEWSSAFNLFVGDSVLDRLNFWNSRLLSENSDRHDFSALCIPRQYFDDMDFVFALGAFLNAHNFKGRGGGPNSLKIRSHSVSRDECEQIAQLLQQHTWSNAAVTDSFNLIAIPSERAIQGDYGAIHGKLKSIKIYESSHKFIVNEVEHFQYLTPDLYDFKSGQCISDLHIEKPKENYTVAGGFNDWKLPRRLEATIAFTRNRAKISKGGTVIVIPDAPQVPLHGLSRPELTISLNIPSEEEVLRCLVFEHIHRLRYEVDMRSVLVNERKYYDVELSDKGQKHRGVISMFDGELSNAALLTNAYWRDIVRKSINNDRASFSIDKLTATINQYQRDRLSHIGDQFRFANVGITKNYLTHNLKDTIEYFIHQGVLIQQYRWRCSYCGNENFLTLDTIKLDNHCSICGKLHKTPIDMEWKYRVSPFIISALIEQNGLTVLWAIDHLMNIFRRPQAFYLPEVNLYKEREGDDKNEIDLLAVIDGKLVVAEVKLSVASFVNEADEIASFIDEVQRIEPDIAYLICEQYCQEVDEVEGFKARLEAVELEIREQIPTVQLQVIVASEIDGFDSVPFEIGPHGDRTDSFFQRLRD
tara:strand:+ start:33171 stop:35651 length:2481 start_codon:yes stop_codon:yes gene_type:complete